MIEHRWATPISYQPVAGWADHVLDLKAAIMAERARSEQGNLDGNSHNVWDWPHPSVTWLREGMSEAARLYLGERGAAIDSIPSYWGRAWGNVLQSGRGFSYHSLHAHHEADFFAVFYVDAGEAEEASGALALMDPRFLNNTHLMNRENRVLIQPRTGWLLLAPGYVWHEVLHYHGQQPRISIACNYQYSLLRIKD
ncbi:MAG: putative 2OG-Fe(II) oxygenase [Oligoflexia bacterium]|nr:putative 2OG-Fe(II) oxygenase [Oligoflexia bacterium]